MGRGGYRSNAGRWGWKGKVENCLNLDVRDLSRKKVLDGWQGQWQWQWSNADTKEVLGTISFQGFDDRIGLTYSWDGKPTWQTIFFQETDCNYGGFRRWFVCPNQYCEKKVAILYMRNGQFKCRHCHNLAYRTQSLDEIGRGWKRQYKIEAKLGQNHERPKGMHYRTYIQHREAINAISGWRYQLFDEMVDSLMASRRW